MIDMEEFLTLRDLFNQELSISKITRQTGHSRVAVFLVPPNVVERIKILGELQDVSGVDHHTQFYHCHLQIERHEFEDADVKALITNSFNGASPVGSLILHRSSRKVRQEEQSQNALLKKTRYVWLKKLMSTESFIIDEVIKNLG